jgi:23S rRNA pseudouridine2605 synthase
MNDTPRGDNGGERIAKAIARAGLCSRRQAETWIVAGRVAVNGQVISSPALDVTAKDRITVDGEPLPQRERTRLFLYHKPHGLVTTNDDPEGRPTIFAALPKHLPRLISVGRLDINSEGLLLLTNDGGLARALELPETGWLRRYRVRAHGTVTPDQLAALRKGITVDGVHYGPIDATLDRPQGSNVWIKFAMREGKNREVRNVLGALGLAVNRLIRVSYGPFQLGDLPEGAIAEIATRHLREQLGERIAAQAGADFSGTIKRGVEAQTENRNTGEADSPRARTRGEAPSPRPSHQIRGKLSPRKHGEGERTRFGSDKSKTGGRKEDKPRKRHRGRDHVWRNEGKPVRSKFRGTRAERQPRERADKGETGVFADRKGRKVTVVRVGNKPKADERPRKRSRSDDAQNPRTRARIRRGFDRRSGPRPSRPRER